MLLGLLLRELDVDRPRLDGDELADLLFAIDDQAERDRRHAAGADALLHLAPEERAQPVADQAVDHAACLLRVDQAHVDLPRRLEARGARPRP